MNQYFGNDSSSIPPTIVNYIEQIRARTGSNSVRIRVGGNSADDSVYVPTQTSPMIVLTDPSASSDAQPANYGPELWKVMQNVSQAAGGVSYLIGMSLNDSSGNDALIAGDAKSTLGNNLDAMLWGNEPDLYAEHDERPGPNYTVQDYIGEFSTVRDHLENTSAGNLGTGGHNAAGPTICCAWDLATLLEQGFLSTFDDILKYVTLQHYPQDNCQGTHAFGLSYYLQHSNAVALASWQKPSIDIIVSNTSATAPKMLMSEFNSASCGGIPGISDTFGAAMWAADYVLQLGSVGFVAAFIHTREQGISYNLVTPPTIDLINGQWVTNPPFYALITVAEILQSDNGVIVADLNIAGSTTNPNAGVAGYAIYDSSNSSVIRTVLFNFGNSSTTFTLPSNSASTASSTTVKYLSAPSATENNTIAWGGETYLGAGDGKLIAPPNGSSWAVPNNQMDCSNGCSVDVPGPSVAVVFYTPVSINFETSSSGTNSSGSSNSSSSSGSNNNQSSSHQSGGGRDLVVSKRLLGLGVLFLVGLFQ